MKMASRFDDETVSDAFDRAVRNGKHLLAKDAAGVAVGRVLAENVDKLKKPKKDDQPFDNVSIPTFLKCLQQLRLLPDPPDPKAAKSAPVAPAPMSELDRFRSKHQAG